MNALTNSFVFLVAALHLWFLILEMFLWKKPLGLRTFKMSPEHAEITASLAANQGLYNGFLAAGLLITFFFRNPHDSSLFRIFFLSCIIVAGIYGAFTVNRRIFFIQALPATFALLALVSGFFYSS